MKKVLVTGATGFIGNYVVTDLVNLGYVVIATSSNKLKAQNFEWYSKVAYVEYDFTSPTLELDYFEYFGRPDLVIHLCWEGLPNYNSLFHFEDNLPRHYSFLKNIILNGCRDITVAGTCLEYGFREGCLKEDMITQPSISYAVAKDSLNKFLLELQKKHFFNLRWVRLFYLFGRGQSPNSLLSQLEKAIGEGREVFNMSGGQQVRDYLPVELASTYLIKVSMQNLVTGIINCCSGKGITVLKFIEDYLIKNKKFIRLNPGFYNYLDYEPMSFWGDTTKLQTIIND